MRYTEKKGIDGMFGITKAEQPKDNTIIIEFYFCVVSSYFNVFIMIKCQGLRR